MYHVIRVLRRLCMIVVMVSVAIPAARATAQGTSGALPGPINSQKLRLYADRLDLSSSQRLAMEAAHDEYRRGFRELREGEIATFLKDQQAVQGGIPQRDVVEEILERFERIHTKIALLDDGLFDELVPMLSERQLSVVPRLRLQRERDRYQALAAQAALGRRIVGLSGQFRELDLTPEEFEIADATMAGYERRLTSILRKMSKSVMRMQLDIMDALTERGYVDISQEKLLEDPELLREIVTAIGEILPELRVDASRLTDDLHSLNKRTYRQIASVIPADEARRFRNMFYRSAFPILGDLVTSSRDDWMTKALRWEKLTDDQRAVLEPASDEFQRAIARLQSDGMEAAERFWEGFSPFDVNPERGEKLQAEIEALKEQGATLHAKLEGTVTDQLGAEAVIEIRHGLAEVAARGKAEGEGEGGDDEAQDLTAEQFPISGDRFLPKRISRRDVRRYAKRMQLPDEMIEVLDVLHSDYMERVAALEVFERLHQAKRTAREMRETPEATAAIDHVFEIRQQALEATVNADAAFFDDVRTIVGKEREELLARVQSSRLRRSWAGRASDRLTLGRGTSNESGVDLVSIVLEQRPTDAELKQLGEVLTAYENNATQAFRARLDAQLEMQRLADRWQSEISAASREDLVAIVELQNEYRETMRQPTARVTRTNETIAKLNRSTLDLVLAELTAARAHEIRQAYELAAFPSIFEDAASVDRHLKAALKLQDLTGEQRAQITNLDGNYRAEYEALSREMMAQLSTTSINVVGLDPDEFKKWQTRQQELARIGFERNELNGRAISRMQAILTDAQVARIGGLPEPIGEDESFFYR
ncbi:MAG: hypothetical protein GY715_19375 [Planctomycetes bacterium]|nr:hypothetical protein [Planctomycetota bacterium]